MKKKKFKSSNEIEETPEVTKTERETQTEGAAFTSLSSRSEKLWEIYHNLPS